MTREAYQPPEGMKAVYRTMVEDRRPAVEAGDGDELLSALTDVCLGRIEMPDWLQTALTRAVRRYRSHTVNTLDEAFNVRRPEGYRRKAMRSRWEHGFAVYFDARTLASAGAVVDEDLFAAVGSLYGIGKTTAAKWYYTFKDRQPESEFERLIAPTALPSRLLALKDAIKWKP